MSRAARSIQPGNLISQLPNFALHQRYDCANKIESHRQKSQEYDCHAASLSMTEYVQVKIGDNRDHRKNREKTIGRYGDNARFVTLEIMKQPFFY